MRRSRKDKSELVPFEKSKRVIHLDKRGKGEKRSHVRRIFARILSILGILCLLYCVSIFFAGYGTYFFLMWGAIGAASLLFGWLLRSSLWTEKLSGWVKGAIGGICGVALMIFCFVEGMILIQFTATPMAGADYCIVLGAQWKSSGPSDVLRRRLDAAVEYLTDNPETRVIVTGGQGSNEMLAEGVGMKSYLVDAGIEETRIIVEDKATNTYENLRFSAEYLNATEDRVILVTNNFHVFRAVKIAEKQGYEHVSGLAADSLVGMLPNNLLREFCGVVKDFIIGNL